MSAAAENNAEDGNNNSNTGTVVAENGGNLANLAIPLFKTCHDVETLAGGR